MRHIHYSMHSAINAGTKILTALALIFVPMGGLWAQTPTAAPVLTWRYDLAHDGQNTEETALTPANVNPTSFGKLFSLSVDSTVFAQPLYVPGLTINGTVHNVLFVCTENDSIYAFDADSNGGADANPLWQVSLLTAAHGAGAGATAVPWRDTGSPDIPPSSGITGTPVIDSATDTMYVVAETVESGVYYSRLHAINILTGAEEAGSPVVITATVAGTGLGSSGGELTFDPLVENQRPALDYYNGYVYIGYAANGDIGDWHGWLFAYNATTLKQSAVLCLSPNDHGAGIWASGAGLPIDDDASGGRMFVVTGNGAISSYPPFSEASDLGESILDINLANGGLTPTDGFTSEEALTLNSHDWDQGSGGILMVPDQQGAYPHILVNGGKEGNIFVLNRDDLGGDLVGQSSNSTALQEIPSCPATTNSSDSTCDADFSTGVTPQGEGYWNTPAYWNGYVYEWPEYGSPMEFTMNSGVMSTTPSSVDSGITSAFPSPSFSISSNGTADGIAWAVESDEFNSDGPAVLYAWNATDLSKPIYSSATNASRDAAGPANKFSIPVVTNGKVYVATSGEIDVYGQLNGATTAAEPTISPDGGTFASTQTVTLSTSTAAANIYYTLDGSTPTTASTQYSGPITVSTDTTVNAIASAPGYLQSAVSSATFTFSNQTPPPAFTPSAGTYLNAQSVTIADTDANAKIYYTTDGTTPSAASTQYAGAIAVKVNETIEAIAIDPSLNNSNVVTAAYVIQNGGTAINFSQGFSSTTGLTLNGSAVADNDTRLQLTNGGLEQAGSAFWNAPINIQAFTTSFEFQILDNGGNGFTFTIQNVGPTALGGDSAGLGYQDIQSSVAVKFNFYDYEDEGSDSTGIYTDGEPPVLPSTDISSSGIELGSGDGIDATITYNGTTLTLNLLDVVTGDTYTMSQAIDIPQVVGGDTAYVGFTGGTGGLSSSQKILTWTYSTEAQAPAFSPVAGTYSAAQSVNLSSATTDAALYYTTNGSAPTPASTEYSSPIAVTSSETIKAIAVSPTLGTSSVSSAAYVIGASTGDASFSMSGSTPAPAAVAPGGTTTSTITLTPSGGFTGTVALSCAVSGQSGAVDTPTCSVAQPAAITGSQAVTAMLTVNTTAATSAAVHYPLGRVFGGGALAALLLFCAPPRRRKWYSLLGALLLIAVISMASGCSNGITSSTGSSGKGGTGSSGTTAGSYTVTVTGTNGSVTEKTSVAVTVQ